MSEFHRLPVAQHCRVCAGKLIRTRYKCSKHKNLLIMHLGLDVECDQAGVHPEVFFNNCWAKLRKLEKATSSGMLAPVCHKPILPRQSIQTHVNASS